MPPIMSVRQDLTDYAFGILPDVENILKVADLFAPRVPVGVASGRYNKFDEQQAFLAYNAARAVGGAATRIKFGVSTGAFDCTPNALEIGIDTHERERAGEGFALLEQAKTRTLICNAAESHLDKVMTTVRASVSAVSNKGEWSDPNVDPVLELDGQIEAIWLASGLLPNTLVLDFGAWMLLKNHPKVIARQPGAVVVGLKAEQLAAMLAAPGIRVEISTGVKAATGFGNATKTKASALGGKSAWLMYTSIAPTQYDPSFCKSFSVSDEMFTNVTTYVEEQTRSDILAVDWSNDVQLISSLLVKRIDVT
jgi:hypothetical protein